MPSLEMARKRLVDRGLAYALTEQTGGRPLVVTYAK